MSLFAIRFFMNSCFFTTYISVALLCMSEFPWLLIRVMPGLFSVSDEAEKMMIGGFIIYGFSYPFKAAVKYMCSYYYAIGRTSLSNALTYLDPLFLTPMFLIALPRIFGMNGIWMAMTLSQVVLSVIGLVTMLIKSRIR